MENSYFTKVLRDSAILTSSYVAGTILGGSKDNGRVEEYNHLALVCIFTKGSLTSVEVKIEKSIDGVNYTAITNAVISGGTTTLTPGVYTTTVDANFSIDADISARFIRVSAQGTGTATGSALEIQAMLQYV